MTDSIENAQELWDAQCDDLRKLIRVEVKRIAEKIIKQALSEVISSGVLIQNSHATAHPRYQPQPKRARA